MPIAIFAPVPSVQLFQFAFSPEPNGCCPFPVEPVEPAKPFFSKQLSAIEDRTIAEDQQGEPLPEVPEIMLKPLPSVPHSNTGNLVSDCAPATEMPEQDTPETGDIIAMISTGYSERPAGIMPCSSTPETSPANRSSDVFFLTDPTPFSRDSTETLSAPLTDKPETIGVENPPDHSTRLTHPKTQHVSDQTSLNVAIDNVQVNPATENLSLPIPLLSVTAAAKSGADIPALTRTLENTASVLIKSEGFVEINPKAENLNHLHIMADSPTLGTVDVNLSQAEHELSIRFTANALTTERLAVHSPELRLAILDSWKHYAAGANGIMPDAVPEDNRISLTFTCSNNDEQGSRPSPRGWMESDGDLNFSNQDIGYLTMLSSKNDTATSQFLSPRSLYLDILI